MAEFRRFLSGLISRVGQEWRKKRAQKKEKDLQKETGIDRDKWFSTLPDDVRDSVAAIVNKLEDSEDVAESFAPVVKALHSLIPEYPLLHLRHLHESLKDQVREYYENKQYGHAADQGAKIYAAKLRELSGSDIDGVALAGLFSIERDKKKIAKYPAIRISDLNTDSGINIQEGQQSLTRGLMQGFRNPVNHAPMAQVVPSVISEVDCLNILSLISYLATRLDKAEVSSDAMS